MCLIHSIIYGICHCAIVYVYIIITVYIYIYKILYIIKYVYIYMCVCVRVCLYVYVCVCVDPALVILDYVFFFEGVWQMKTASDATWWSGWTALALQRFTTELVIHNFDLWWFVMISRFWREGLPNGTVGFKGINGFQENQWCSSLRPWFSCAQVPTMEGLKMPTLVRTPMATIRPRSPRPSPWCGEVHEAWNIVNMLIQC